MQGTDRRVKRTRAALAQALLELADERHFAEVTIRELTERADVGYATFFRHYPSKEALLLEVLSGVVDDLADLLQPAAEEGRLEDAGCQLFEYAASNALRLRVLFDAQRGSTFERDVRSAIETRVLASPSFEPPPAVPRELAAHHLAVSTLGMVGWWLERGMPLDIETMGRIYARLVVAPARSV